MNAYKTGDNSNLGRIKLTGPHAELMMQLEKLLSYITSDETIDMQAVPEVCRRLLLKCAWNLTMNGRSSVLESGAYATEHRRLPGISLQQS
jgi:hypothetical protein